MKNIIQVYCLICFSCFFDSQAYAANSIAPQVQMLLQSCDTPSNLDSAKSIEVYGVVESSTGAISNLSVLQVVTFDVGDIKMIIQGGFVTGTPGSDAVYSNILGSDASLAIKNNVGTLTYNGKQTVFANCK